MKILLPYEGKVQLTSKYGSRVLNGKTEFHAGIDLVGLDSKIVRSPVDGIVMSSAIITDENNITSEWGNYVRIDANDYTRLFFAHLKSRAVKVGQKIRCGDIIGIEGCTGKSYGNHCHFEIRLNNSAIDPTKFMDIQNEIGVYSNNQNTHMWSQNAVEWALTNDILRGYSQDDEVLKLQDNVNREELVVFLKRLYDLFK